MQRLFLFFYKYRAFFTFLLLEVICIWLVVDNNNYQGAKFFNSSNAVIGNVISSSRDVSDYFNLTEVNEQLMEENTRLKNALGVTLDSPEADTVFADSLIVQDADTVLLPMFRYMAAKVENNSTRRPKNYLTIRIGAREGVEPGMAVINDEGVVGIVKNVSKHFSVVTSVLHKSMLVSSKLKSNNELCTTSWDGLDPRKISLNYLPKHVELNVGDTVVTSGFNAVFPEGTMIGVVANYSTTEDSPFYTVEVDLSTSFNRLSYVYVVENVFRHEQDSLQQLILQAE